MDESHNIISMITNYLSEESNETSNIKGRLFWKLFMNSKNTKFVFLSGTPILNYPKELSAVFNILQGPKILYNYRITTKLNSNELIENMNNHKIFSCGPVTMMVGIRQMVIKKSIPCDLALERIMACGFGICQGCTIERKNAIRMDNCKD